MAKPIALGDKKKKLNERYQLQGRNAFLYLSEGIY